MNMKSRFTDYSECLRGCVITRSTDYSEHWMKLVQDLLIIVNVFICSQTSLLTTVNIQHLADFGLLITVNISLHSANQPRLLLITVNV
ncbi:hypothetical protein Pat9b_5167 (plasmid) [Pantoea sp. At-9b]|nr:hypothetical protein Pat9b_5167 [Pantoea sp. At-9b]